MYWIVYSQMMSSYTICPVCTIRVRISYLQTNKSFMLLVLHWVGTFILWYFYVIHTHTSFSVMYLDDVIILLLLHCPTYYCIVILDSYFFPTAKLYSYRFYTGRIPNPLRNRYCTHFYQKNLDLELFKQSLQVFPGNSIYININFYKSQIYIYMYIYI